MMSENQVILFFPLMLPLSAWQDETASTFPTRISQQWGRHGSWASSKRSSLSCPQWASPGCKLFFPVDLVPSSGGYEELQRFICVSVKWLFSLFFFSSFKSTVTMVLFLVGISVAVNNSTHENQTAGNSCCIPLYSKQVYEVKVWNFWHIQKIRIALNHTGSYCTVSYSLLWSVTYKSRG